MEHDFMSRGYLLPDGCKDLIDVLKLKSKPQLPSVSPWIDLIKLPPAKPKKQKFQPTKFFPEVLASSPPMPLPQLVIPAETTVAQLATLLHVKVFEIIVEVMTTSGLMVTATETLSFDVISRVARAHGYCAVAPRA